MKKNLLFTVVLTLLLVSLLAACGPAASIQAPSVSAPAAATTVAATTSAAPAKPTGELVASIAGLGNEVFVPWKSDLNASQVCDVVYDCLTYWDEINRKFLPGLADSWEVSPDAKTITYKFKKGIQFSDGWGEMTSEDVKFNFEKQAGTGSIGWTAATRNIASMETPDLSTLVIHFKKPAPTFVGVFSFGNAGFCQGIASKKYVETVGEETAAKKPIGTGPYRLVEGQLGSHYKFEALDSHWRVVPEFKTLTIRAVSEISTLIAALKNKEVDLAQVPADQMADLKAAGLATEVSPVGGAILLGTFGGLAIPADDRYDSEYHNKDPWTDIRVRKAMTISIDRQAICNAIFAGGATPAGVPLISANMDKFQYPFDPAAAKQLLADAGYPNGFSFKVISFTIPGLTETSRIVEALTGYWQQIGLDPKITVVEYTTYTNNYRMPMKMAGEISLMRIATSADMLDKTATQLMPGGPVIIYEDEGSYAIWKEGNAKVTAEERSAYVEKLNQYYYDNYGPLPIVRISYEYSWNPDKISPFPHPSTTTPLYLEYVRHAQPLNTFRLFTPWPGR